MQITYSKKGTQVEATCPIYVRDDVYNQMRYIEITGPQTVIRAMWANIGSTLDGRSNYGIHTDLKIWLSNGKHVDVVIRGDTKTHRIQQKNRIVMFTEEMHEKYREVIYGGSVIVPSPFFMDSMRKRVDQVPVLQEWENILWRVGIDEGAIKPMDVFGKDLQFWKIAGNHKWKTIVENLAKEGVFAYV